MVKVMRYFNNLIREITREEIEDLYNKQNQSQFECAQHLDISVSMFIRLLKYYDIHKEPGKHTEKIAQVKLERYGSATYNNRMVAKETCLGKYGVDNPFRDREAMQQAWIEKLGVDHPMRSPEVIQKNQEGRNYIESSQKGRQTYFEKTGYSNPSKNPECIKKNLQTRIDHGVFDSPGTSNIERRFEKLLKRKFPAVLAHYRDARYGRATGYTFECDFYIPSEDLFIELNGHPSHYKHPFNESNPKDAAVRDRLINSSKPWDQKLLETWTFRDVEKRECAAQQKLNYLVIYPYTSLFENLTFNDSKYADLIRYLFKKLQNK